MLRRKGNLPRALEDTGRAIDFLQVRVAEHAAAVAELAANSANAQQSVALQAPISNILGMAGGVGMEALMATTNSSK